MSVRKAIIFCYVSCGRCENQEGGYYRNAKTISQIKKATSAWVGHDVWGNLCPECQSELKRAKKELGKRKRTQSWDEWKG